MNQSSKERKNTKSTISQSHTTLTSDKTNPHGIGAIDLRSILATTTIMPQKIKKEISWTKILIGNKNNNTNEPQQEPILFSDLLKKGKVAASPEINFSKTFSGPSIKDCPLPELAMKPGHVPVLKLFHVESHRERAGSDDDGLFEDDLTASDGIVRKPKVTERRASRRRSYIYEAIKMAKGEFIFSHRTYRPKVQVAYRVPPGQVPQAVVIERLHRLYKRTDINLVCQTIGIELKDLLPPPHYGETNERFYQESMFRNRTRVNGQDKRDFIRSGGRAAQEEHAGERLHRHADEAGSTSEGSSDASSESGENEEEELNQHPFVKSKPPFGSQFPLDFFDDEEFDIRSGEDWIKLGLDSNGRVSSPIPGKAFLPMPMSESKRLLPALSEVTYIDLLKKTETLDKFRKWILKERYLRRAGPDARVSMAPSEAEMTFVARSTTTVPMIIPDKGSSPDLLIVAAKPAQSSNESELSDKRDDDEIDGEHSPGGSEEISLTATTIDEEMDELMKQFKKAKKIKEITPEENVKLDGPIRSESILSDIFSDPNSLVLTPEGTSEMTTAQIYGTRFGEFDESVIDLEGMMATGHIRGNHYPGSPDFDPYDEDGYETLVFEYDKMKKVHNHDWRWVDVAIFSYDSEKRRYFVRSIFHPYVYAWVNKLYLLMDGEDPNKHGERIKNAIIRRIESEYHMRYNLYVDCLPVTLAPQMFPNLMEIISLKTLSTPKLQRSRGSLKKVEKEITLEWQRTHMKLHFDHIIEKHPKLYRPWVVLHDDHQYNDWDVQPNTEFPQVVQRYNECTTCNFAYKVTRVQKASAIYKIEVYQALGEIIGACLQARRHPFLLTRQSEPVSIDEYEFRQNEQMREVKQYLRNEWVETILSSIRVHLDKIPKSWYNIDEYRWEVYEMSKISKYLTLIRFVMENTLGFMVEESLGTYVEEIKTLTQDCTKIERGYEWQNDLKTSDFPTPDGMTPLFKLELYMDRYGPKYTQLLGRYPNVTNQIFFNCIDAASGIPDIVPLIMKSLLFGNSRLLHSIERTEPAIISLRHDLKRYLQRGLLPVDIYAQKFKYYMPVWNLDMTAFMTDWEGTEHTTKEIKHTVDFHIKHMREIDNELPTTIDISAFRINVEIVKLYLIKRKKVLYMAILDSFCTKLRNQITQIKDEYTEIEKKLTTRSDDIEEVMELKTYVETIPQILIQKEEQIQKILKDYEMFERFKYPIPLDDTDLKWSTALGTTKLTRMVDDTILYLDDDYDRLLKVQQFDLSALSDLVDSITLSVAGLVAFVELEKASEVSQEVKKIWKQVKDLQEHSDLLNKRQKIFGLPPAQNEALIRLGKDIEPFKNLWFTAADWIRIQDTCFKETLDKVDIEAVVKMISEGGKTIRRCVRYFTGADAIQHIAEEVRHQIEEFKPLVPLIKTLKNIGMRQRHWEAITDICGFTVVAKGNQSFRKLLDQGINEFVDAIAEVGETATHEAKIEITLDRMQRDINLFKIKVIPDTNSDVHIIVLPAGVMDLIEADIKVTDGILNSPYRTPFEERLGYWGKKITQTKENLDNWIECQKDWLDLQESFKSLEIQTKLPNEFKLFHKMERIWRRVLRLARDMPDVLDIGSDTTLRASLFQFTGLLAKCHLGLEELMKPARSDSDEDIPADTNVVDN